jgi:hypothetical protein
MLAGVSWDVAVPEWNAVPDLWDFGELESTDVLGISLGDSLTIFADSELTDHLRLRLRDLALGSSNITTGDDIRLTQALDTRTLCVNDWPQEIAGAGSWNKGSAGNGSWAIAVGGSGSWSVVASIVQNSEGCSS